MAGDDGVDLGLPFIDGLQIFRIVGARHGLLPRQPAGEAAHGQFGIDVGTGADNDVKAFSLGHLEGALDIAHAGKIVLALFGGMIAPVDIERHGVITGRLHLLQHIAPQRRRGQAEGLELTRPDHDALAVDHQRMAIPGHGGGFRFRFCGGLDRGGGFTDDGEMTHRAGDAAQFLFRRPGVQVIEAVGVPIALAAIIIEIDAPAALALGIFDRGQGRAFDPVAPARPVAGAVDGPWAGQAIGPGAFQSLGRLVLGDDDVAVTNLDRKGIYMIGAQSLHRLRGRKVRQVGVGGGQNIGREGAFRAAGGQGNDNGNRAVRVLKPFRRPGIGQAWHIEFDVGQVFPVTQVMAAGNAKGGGAPAGGIDNIIEAIRRVNDRRIAQQA